MDFERRFGGIARLYGAHALAALNDAHVCVVGVGGVGSWAVEALARSALGRLTLIDMDHVAESNMNRQLQALDAELGRAKIDVLRERVAQINPRCDVIAVDAFVTRDNVADVVAADCAWVVDCIDSFRVKAAMIAHCRRRRQPLITVGAAGGQRDPTRIRIGDLRRTEQDPLLARTRRILRREYGFPTNPQRRFGVPCVWSDEPQESPGGCDASPEGSLNCAGYGASVAVTASFGLAAAGYVIERLATPPAKR
ncbi:MAG: tRNA threonylcarbamoyladenosine dehydratase [Gammaproteobacteria bacterium]|nr:tRNA threonylcarbamoyladenosine dehydratase [Gammaproteobacteria bacterium]